MKQTAKGEKKRKRQTKIQAPNYREQNEGCQERRCGRAVHEIGEGG